MQTWRLVKSPPSDAFTNMAVDEAIMKMIGSGGSVPTLRFYAWATPAVSVGYFQDSLSEVDLAVCREMGIDVVRRLTGGRAVLHDRELTYSVICPDNDPHFPDNIMGTYKIISTCLVRGLKTLGIDASLTPLVRKRIRQTEKSSSACFSSPSDYEITVSGHKLVGSAQRRGDGVFLQHGSILMEFDRSLTERLFLGSGNLNCVTSINEHLRTDTAAVISSLIQGFEEVLGISFVEGPLTNEELSMSKKFAEDKYLDHDWNLRRPSLISS